MSPFSMLPKTNGRSCPVSTSLWSAGLRGICRSRRQQSYRRVPMSIQRRLLTGAVLAFVFASAAFSQPASGQAAPRSGAARGPTVVSPEILPDKKVTFRLLASKAGEVLLNGNWDNGRNIKMTKDEAGVWSVTVDPLNEQLWGYSFSVDGVKVLDPGTGEYQRDGSRYDNLLMISGPASDLWELKPDIPHVAVQSMCYPSEILK